MTISVHVQSHYSIEKIDRENGMSRLRAMFPSATADDMNFVLFSTSGVHGTYMTIEEVELALQAGDPDTYIDLTFTIVHPRLVCMRYGNAIPALADIPFLKKLRSSSWKAVAKIGAQD